MPNHEFESLGERLWHAGIAPKHVRRLITELRDHFALLLQEELARGQPMEVARAAARSRLGTEDEILGQALAQPALRAWGARWPFLVCGLAPVAGLALLWVAALLALASIFTIAGQARTLATPWLQGATEGVGWVLRYVLPPVWACVVARYVATRRLSVPWPLIGLVAMAALGAATTINLVWPAAGDRGHLSAGIGFSTSPGWLAGFTIRWLITAGLAGAAYYGMRQRPRDTAAG